MPHPERRARCLLPPYGCDPSCRRAPRRAGHLPPDVDATQARPPFVVMPRTPHPQPPVGVGMTVASVFQRGHTERPLPPVGLGDVRPADRLRPIGSALQPCGEVAEVVLQRLAVLPPRHPVHARRSFPLEAEVRLPEHRRIVDVVQERGEPKLPILSRCLTYPLQRSVHAGPALSPGRGVLSRIPFGQAPSLHPLRGRAAGDRRGRRRSLVRVRRFRLRARVGSTVALRSPEPFLVRGLLGYYGPVRLPVSVHHRRASSDFPTRPAAPSAAGGHGTSRFPCKVFPYVPGVSDRAGSQHASRLRRGGCCLPPLLTTSAPRRNGLSRLNTRPARTPVNASR